MAPIGLNPNYESERRRRRTLIVLAAVLLVAAVAGARWLLKRDDRPALPASGPRQIFFRSIRPTGS